MSKLVTIPTPAGRATSTRLVIFLEPAYLCVRIIGFVAAVRLPASQHELSGWNRFALAIRKIASKKNPGFASPAEHAEIPPLIHRTRVGDRKSTRLNSSHV